MSSRKFKSKKDIKSKDATIKDIEKLESLLDDVRRRPKGMKTAPKFDEIEDILNEIRKDYKEVIGEEIGKFRLKQKKSHQQFEKDYTLTTIVASPEEIFRREGKIIKKTIPKNLEFIITIKTFLKNGKKEIDVSINKPETSEVDLGEDIKIVCATPEAGIPRGVIPPITTARPSPPSARKPISEKEIGMQEQRQALLKELREKFEERKKKE